MEFADLLYVGACLLLIFATLLLRFKANKEITLYLFALTLWTGSEVATQFISSNWASIGYVLFYPIFFLAIPQLFEISQASELVRLLDGAILVLGFSTIATALLLRSIRADFLHILYPICDLILLIAVLTAFVRRPINGRSLLVLLGFLTYATTDFIYLIRVAKNQYQINSIIDYGWLLAFTLMTAALFRRGIKSEEFPPISIFYLALSVVSSSLMLAVIALELYGIPNFVIGPALATLFASFIRMAVALKQSEKSTIEKNLAKIDDLTGLPNRRRFISELDKFGNGSILLLDLDDFKPVNDKYGHEAGNEVLRQVSNRFQKVIPNNSLLARLGGDEFAVLTHDGYEAAMELAMALRATLSYPLNVDGESIKVDVSIGCVTNDGRSDLLSRADTAMYKAKKSQVGVWAGRT